MGYLPFKKRFTIPDYTDPNELTTGDLSFDEEKCIRCGLCAGMCPARSIRMGEKKAGQKKKPMPYLTELLPGMTACIACGDCITACPEKAISVARSFLPTLYYERIHQGRNLAFPKKY